MIRQWVCEGELNGISSNATIANMTAATNSTTSKTVTATAGVIKSANSYSTSAHQHAHSGSANSSDFFIVCNEVSE
jgi:hypothetical protein